jgi:hypothetical protein
MEYLYTKSIKRNEDKLVKQGYYECIFWGALGRREGKRGGKWGRSWIPLGDRRLLLEVIPGSLSLGPQILTSPSFPIKIPTLPFPAWKETWPLATALHSSLVPKPLLN